MRIADMFGLSLSMTLTVCCLLPANPGQDAFASAQQLRRAGQLAEAVELLSTARDTDPGDLEVAGLLGLCLLDGGDQSAAAALAAELRVSAKVDTPDLAGEAADAEAVSAQALAELADGVVDSFRCLVFLGRWQATQGREEQAVPLLEIACGLKPRPVEALVELGRCLREMGRQGQGQQVASELTALVPELGRRLAADLYLDQGDRIARRAAQNVEAMPRALEVYRAAYECAPDDDHIAERLLFALINNMRTAEARALLPRVAPEAERPFEFHLQSGRIADLGNDPVLAEQHFGLALQATPDHPDAAVPLCRLLCDRGAVEQAVAQLEQVLAKWPLRGDVHLQLGLAEVSRERFVEAEASLRRAVELSPNDRQSRYQLGRVLTRLGRREEAREMLAGLSMGGS